jgi:methyl-galactoside transport system permease protein
LGQNNSAPIAGLDPGYTRLVTGGINIGGVQIPNYLWIAVLVTLIVWVIWNKTVLGKNMFAVGTNPEAAAVSGVSVAKTIISVFILAGILYGVSAFVECARVSSNSTATGVNYELDAIAACVIGGVSFMGGVGKVRGVLLGVFLLQLVNAGLVFLNFEPAVMTVIKGAIILIACSGSSVLRSAFFISTILRSWALVTLPTLFLLGTPLPLARPASFLRSTDAGGDLNCSEKLRSW